MINSGTDNFERSGVDRRQFLRTLGVIGSSAVLSATAESAQGAPEANEAQGAPADQPIPRRPLGKSGVMLSAIGMGGHHLGDIKDVDTAIQMVHEAIGAGINFFDNCWEYYNGLCEDILGRALKGRRDQVFLMTKVCTHGRSGELAMRMLEQSLHRLQTDHLDLWQIHALGFENDPELAYAKGGVLEALERAKEQGKTRFVGFTGHKDPLVHLKMIQMGFPFDTVQMPLNPFDGTYHSFEQIVLPEARRRGISVLGMKSMGGTAESVKKGVLTAQECLRYAMSLPVTVTICGMDSPEVLKQNLAVARGFRPLSEADMQALRQRVAPLAADGRYEVYKGSLKFDNPVTRLSHGFPIDEQQKEVQRMLKVGSGTWETV